MLRYYSLLRFTTIFFVPNESQVKCHHPKSNSTVLNSVLSLVSASKYQAIIPSRSLLIFHVIMIIRRMSELCKPIAQFKTRRKKLFLFWQHSDLTCDFHKNGMIVFFIVTFTKMTKNVTWKTWKMIIFSRGTEPWN